MTSLAQAEASMFGDLLSWVGFSGGSEKMKEDVVVESNQVEEVEPPAEEEAEVGDSEANVESQETPEPIASPPTDEL